MDRGELHLIDFLKESSSAPIKMSNGIELYFERGKISVIGNNIYYRSGHVDFN